jgi:hypothetical protein
MSASSQQVKSAYDLTVVNTLTSAISLAGVSYLLWNHDKQTWEKPLVAGTVVIMSLIYIGVTIAATVNTSSTPAASASANPINLQVPCDITVGTEFYWNFIATPLFIITMGWSLYVLFKVPTSGRVDLESL